MKRYASLALLFSIACGLPACSGTPSALGAPPADTSPPLRLDLTKSGVHTSGRWTYRFSVVAPGSKSEGYRGELLFDGVPVEQPPFGDYYRTPWGDIVWLGDPVTMWGEHGWMPRDPAATGGHAIVEPWRSAGRPIVMVMMLAPGKAETKLKADPWVAAEMGKLRVTEYFVERDWVPLTDQALTLHDTKNYGTLHVRQAQPRSSTVLSVLAGGSAWARIDLPRQDGATRLVHYKFNANLEPLDVYLAFRVDRASNQWRAPRDIGPDADGKTVEVGEVDEIVIALPGDTTSGNIWTVAKIACDDPRAGALKLMGEPQFVQSADGGHAVTGAYENLFRVLAVGTCDVELAYHRPWQTEVPPSKMFRVTLKVTELPMRLPMRTPGGGK